MRSVEQHCHVTAHAPIRLEEDSGRVGLDGKEVKGLKGFKRLGLVTWFVCGSDGIDGRGAVTWWSGDVVTW